MGLEVEGPAGMAGEPLAQLGMLVDGVVVNGGMDDFTSADMRFDGIEKANELLMAMALHVAADNRSVEHIQRSEQRGSAVALVVVCHGSRTAFLHRQARLSSVECLNLAFFVDRQDDGVCRGIDIEADNVAELLSEFRVLRQLEAPNAVRSELVGLQNGLPDE